MKVEVRFRAMEASAALREQVVRRVQSQLSRFDGVVRLVVGRIWDINGPKGGADKQCRLTIRGPGLGSFNIQDLSADPYSAAELALTRATRALGRERRRTRVARRPDPAFGSA